MLSIKLSFDITSRHDLSLSPVSELTALLTSELLNCISHQTRNHIYYFP